MAGPDSDDELLDSDLFREPESFRPATPPPTFTSYTLRSGRSLQLRLVGHNPLWAHYLWNGGREVSAYLEDHAERLVRGRTVLELGAGAALPGIVAALCGAAEVVVSDYPDPPLVENMTYNIDHALAEGTEKEAAQHSSAHAFPCLIQATGYLWGASLPPPMQPKNKFNLLILADVVFNHSEHIKLAHTVTQTLSRNDPAAVALVFFTPYRPWLLEKDMDFFRVVEEHGLVARKLFERKLDKEMFERDRGDLELRRTVFGFEVQWATPHQGEAAQQHHGD